VFNTTSGINAESSSITTLKDSNFTLNGSEDIIKGGAIYLKDSNSSILNSLFDTNSAQIGGSIAIEWTDFLTWANEISHNHFTNNVAPKEGGAVYYDFRRPTFINNSYVNNESPYGPNIASYAVRIVKGEDYDSNIKFDNLGSGVKYPEELEFRLIDYDNQTIVLANTGQIKIVPVSSNATVSGIDAAKITLGAAIFDDLAFNYRPGVNSIKFKATSAFIDSKKTSYLVLPTDNSITVNFRYCKARGVSTSRWDLWGMISWNLFCWMELNWM
jgi:hypothetical protein